MKYPPSIAAIVLLDILAHRLSRFFSTLFAKVMFKAHACRVGKNFIADGRVIIRSQKVMGIQIGTDCTIYSRVGVNLVGLSHPAILHCWRSGNIAIGNHVGMSSPVISSRASVEIGNRVNLGGNVRIYDHDFHSLDPLHRQDASLDQANVKSARVQIDNDVFVGANVMILKGVHIGARSVIGAGSVVALKEIPPDSLVVGNPAKVVRNLSDVGDSQE